MYNQITGYDVGALLYCPANLHNNTIVRALKEESIAHPFSLAFCLEDTIPEALVEEAEQILQHTLQEIQHAKQESSFYLPLIFVRIRSPKHLYKLALQFQNFSDILTGFILPKFFIDNCADYIAAIQNLETQYRCNYFYMPIFESSAMVPLNTRYTYLAEIKECLNAVADKILNIRIGGNDFSNVFALRRHVHNTIYDLQSVSSLLVDISTTFSTQYVVSAPVWEYYAGENWDTGLRNEIMLDLCNGLIGKTVIHPNQIPIVNEMLKVTQADYHDACAILNWDLSGKTLVSANCNAHRMNEYLTHQRWAEKIIHLSKIYGVKA